MVAKMKPYELLCVSKHERLMTVAQKTDLGVSRRLALGNVESFYEKASPLSVPLVILVRLSITFYIHFTSPMYHILIFLCREEENRPSEQKLIHL